MSRQTRGALSRRCRPANRSRQLGLRDGAWQMRGGFVMSPALLFARDHNPTHQFFLSARQRLRWTCQPASATCPPDAQVQGSDQSEGHLMTTHVNTIVVGGGQAGLAVSHFLTLHGQEHLVLEQADAPANAWRNHRWDSFTLNTPRWQSRLPGVHYGEDDPDGFMPRDEVVAWFEELARPLPVRYRMRVVAIERDTKAGRYTVEIEGGEWIKARNVVVATGLYQTAKIPALSGKFPPHIQQLHSDSYRNPGQLLPGAVLVVGSAQSGAQIAEELYEIGRKVFLAVGRAGRTPRRYRGKDANWWLATLGHYDREVSELPSPKAKFSGKPHISGW